VRRSMAKAMWSVPPDAKANLTLGSTPATWQKSHSFPWPLLGLVNPSGFTFPGRLDHPVSKGRKSRNDEDPECSIELAPFVSIESSSVYVDHANPRF
jgi:hypothetical protein